MMKNVSFIAPGEDSGAWRFPKKDRSRGFVWPLVEVPVNSTPTDSVKMIIALFYQRQESRLLAELSKVMDYSGDDSGVNLKEATVSFVSFRESNEANKTANLFL